MEREGLLAEQLKNKQSAFLYGAINKPQSVTINKYKTGKMTPCRVCKHHNTTKHLEHNIQRPC